MWQGDIRCEFKKGASVHVIVACAGNGAVACTCQFTQTVKSSLTVVKIFRDYQSSEWAERGFCSHCGSSLYYHLKPGSEVPEGEYMLAAGSVSDQSQLKFDHEVYVDAAPGWYRFEGEASRHRLTDADILAVFAPDAE